MRTKSSGWHFLLVCLGIACSSPWGAEAEPAIRYLGIGNSFTWNSTKYLDEVVASQEKDMLFFVAGIGGSSMEEHMRRVRLFEEDPENPEGRPYRRAIEGAGEGEDRFSLKEVLQQEPWDYVSIQQLSRLSFLPESYEPHAEELIAYVRQYAPQAEILVHMTWSYREDHQWFVEGEMSQEEMYAKLSSAYQDLARRYGLRIIPLGAAIQEARKAKEWRFSYPDPGFNYESAKPPALPEQPGSLAVGWYWREGEEGAQPSLRLDGTHLNAFGCYLGALTHFEFFFGEPVDPEVFRLPELDEAEWANLRAAAHRAVTSYADFNRRVAAESASGEPPLPRAN